MDRADDARRVFGPEPRGVVRREALDGGKLVERVVTSAALRNARTMTVDVPR